MDWTEIKTEYIAGGTSYRKLAEKYNVSFSTLRKIAAKENWTELRNKARAESDTKIIKTVDKKNAEQAEMVTTIANKLLTKLGEAIDLVDVIDSQTFKQYTSALKDLKDIKGIKSESDMREQEARIANLRRQAEADADKTTGIEIVFEAGPEEWNE